MMIMQAPAAGKELLLRLLLRLPLQRPLRIGLFGLAGSICLALAACQRAEEVPRDYSVLAADVHVAVAGYQLVLPFIALENYRATQSFSLNRKRDAANQADATAAFLREASNPANPMSFDRLSIRIDTYGWNDADLRQRTMCPMLTREWARSVCDNPWAAIQQALPQRFELVDLSGVRFHSPEPRTPRCARNGTPPQAFPDRAGEAVLLCALDIHASDPEKFHVALVRIDGHLGAAWSVWNDSPAGESADMQAAREGRAIVAFVRDAIGKQEDFPQLYATVCGLRAPNSPAGIRRLECGDTARR